MNRMLGYLKGYERESVLAPLFKMLEATFDLFVPLVMADIVNVGIAAHDLHYILVRCGLLLLLAFIGLTCSLTAQYFSAKAAVGYSTALRHALFAHIQSLSFSEMDTLGTSTLITRMTSDINQVQSGLNLFLRLFLRSPFVVLGAMVMAFTVNARAAMIFVVTIPLLSVVVFGVMVITRPLYKTVQTRLDRVLGLTRENLTGVRVVRAFDKEQSEIDRFESANDLLTRMQLHVGHISSLMSPLTYVIINLAIVALLYVGSIEINVGGMASGDVIAVMDCDLQHPPATLVQMYRLWQDGCPVGVCNLYRYTADKVIVKELLTEPEVCAEQLVKQICSGFEGGSIEFRLHPQLDLGQRVPAGMLRFYTWERPLASGQAYLPFILD